MLHDFLTGDIIMQPKNGILPQTILSQLHVDGQMVKETSTGIVIVRLNDWNVILDVANSIYESGLVDWCHPDFITEFKRFTNDPLFTQQYYLKNTGQNGGKAGIDINAEQAWAITQSNNSIRVAVIDDGVEDHEDLADRVLQGYTPLDSTGYGRPTTQTVPGITIGHGECCAGIIAASQNTLGIAGIAPNVQIVPINIFNRWVYSSVAQKYVSSESVQDIAAGIEYAWNPTKGNADVISNSWGYTNTPNGADYITTEINNAVNQGRLRNGVRLGCVVVFAAGNENPTYGISFPASLSNVITVGAINKNGTVWSYSCRGEALNVVAPSGNTNQAGDITTIDRMGSNGYETGNYTAYFGGTSAAAPQVAGIAALILSVRPDLTQAQVRQAIESTCQKINQQNSSNLSGYTYSNNTAHPNGSWNSEVGYGLVNAYAAVNFVAPTISGPDVIAQSCQADYTISNLPPSATNIHWDIIADNHALLSDDGATSAIGAVILQDRGANGCTVKRTNNVYDPDRAVLRCLFDYNGQNYVAVQTVQVRIIPVIYAVFDIACYCAQGEGLTGHSYYFESLISPYQSMIQDYSWLIEGEVPFTYSFSGQSTMYQPVKFSAEGMHTIKLSVYDGCEWIRYVSIPFYVRESGLIYFSILPNPASAEVSIEITNDTAGDQSNAANATEPAYTVSIVDVTGTTAYHGKKKGKKFQLSTSSLSNGIYNVIVSDGVKTGQGKLIVKH